MSMQELEQLRAERLATPIGTARYDELELAIEEIEGHLLEQGPTAAQCRCGEVDTVWPESNTERQHYMRCWACGAESTRADSPAEAVTAWNAGHRANRRQAVAR